LAGSWVALLVDGLLDDGVLDEPLDDGLLEEPLAAPELGVELGEEELEPLLELAPPDAESFLVVSEDEDEDEDGLLGVLVLPELDAEPEGELGVVVPDDAAPEPEVVRDAPVPALSPQAVSILVPNARDTASARVESLISGPPWLG
jgi:hypothetical protein